MTLRIAFLGIMSLAALLISGPARLSGQQAPDAQHDQHHPGTTAPPAAAAGQQSDMAKMMATMHASDQKLDELVKKMNAAQGTAKVDAVAELLTALVQDRRTMHESMMSNMSRMMNMMGSMQGRSDATPKK
jgi:hypothetical protein